MNISCAKDKVEYKEFYGINTVMREFAAYKVGSYFSYIDSATNEYDSIYVVEMVCDTVFIDQGYFPGYHETLVCFLKNSKGNPIYLSIPVFQNSEGRSYIRYEKTDQTTSHDFFSFIAPIEIGQNIKNFGGQETQIVGLIDSIKIDSKVYHDIIEVRLTKDRILSSDTSYMYYAKGIGLVKWCTSDYSRNLRLSNYKVIY